MSARFTDAVRTLNHGYYFLISIPAMAGKASGSARSAAPPHKDSGMKIKARSAMVRPAAGWIARRPGGAPGPPEKLSSAGKPVLVHLRDKKRLPIRQPGYPNHNNGRVAVPGHQWVGTEAPYRYFHLKRRSGGTGFPVCADLALHGKVVPPKSKILRSRRPLRMTGGIMPQRSQTGMRTWGPSSSNHP